jgi:hypothetical protein
MDLSTDLPTTLLGYGSLWVCVDRLSKVVHLKAINKTITAPELAGVLRDEILRLHGLPNNNVSDGDPRFTAAF